MRAYEFPVRVTEEGHLELPERLAEVLPRNQTVRMIVLVPEAVPYDTDLTPEEEDEGWLRLGEEEALARYDEADAVYDHVVYQPVK